MDVKNEGARLARQGSSRKSQISAHDISRVEVGGVRVPGGSKPSEK